MLKVIAVGWVVLFVVMFGCAYWDVPEYPWLVWGSYVIMVMLWFGVMAHIGSRTPPWMLK